jgi:hypothetical protein
MPFDGAKLSDVTAELIRARNLLEQPMGWRQPGGCGGRKGRYCTILALSDTDTGRKAQDALKAQLGVKFLLDVYNWNDAPERTVEEVLHLYDRAIANAL